MSLTTLNFLLALINQSSANQRCKIRNLNSVIATSNIIVVNKADLYVTVEKKLLFYEQFVCPLFFSNDKRTFQFIHMFTYFRIHLFLVKPYATQLFGMFTC